MQTLQTRKVLIVGNFLTEAMVNRAVCEDLAERLVAAEWPIITTSTYPGRLHRMVDMVSTTWTKRHLYDVAIVDVYSGLAFWWANIIGRLLHLNKKPFVLVLRGGNLPEYARRFPGRVKRLLHTATTVTVPSAFLQKQMRPYREDLLVLPNPLDLSRYVFNLRMKPQPRLVWLRAFHKIYNPALAPRVLAQLVTEFPDIQLIMVGPNKGDGSLEETQRVASALGIAERIYYSGQVSKNEVPLWLNKGDILLNTTNVDNTPVSVMEAMASGLCVVSTNVGGIPYLLDDGIDALLVSPNDVNQMQFAVRRLLTEPKLSTALSYQARVKAEQWDWSNVLLQWKHILLSI